MPEAVTLNVSSHWKFDGKGIYIREGRYRAWRAKEKLNTPYEFTVTGKDAWGNPITETVLETIEICRWEENANGTA